MKNEKWIMFKNYMHNELDISKDDIRQWINEAVYEIARLEAYRLSEGFDMKTLVTDAIETDPLFFEKQLKDEIQERVAKKLASMVEIKVKKI